VFLWEETKPAFTTVEDHLKSIQNKLVFEVKPLSDLSRGTIPMEGYPVLIAELLFPPELPKGVVPYIK
jgi:hypothetical protein